MKTNTLSWILVSFLTGFAFLPPAHSAEHNTPFGDGVLENNKGDNNTGFGFATLRGNIFGNQNTGTGALALNRNTWGSENTATGFQALVLNSVGDGNTATGQSALQNNTKGNNNTAIGLSALLSNTTGRNNTAAGSDALSHNTTGSFNVALGAGAGSAVSTADDVICIGRGVVSDNFGGTCFIGNIRGVQTLHLNALPVVIDVAGQLGTVASSERFKKDIATMGQASEGILAFRPVTFHYKTDTENTPQFGLIAEEVAKVNPALVVPDKEGKPYSVRYDQVNAMLLNEFLKEHKAFVEEQHKVKGLEATVAQQQKSFEAKLAKQETQIAALTSGLQKVTAQFEVSKAAPQSVLNDH